VLHDSVVCPVIAPVVDGGDRLGYVVQWRRVVATIRVNDSKVYLGSTGSGLWTDLSVVAAPPPVDVRRLTKVVRYSRPGAEPVLALSAALPRAPWLVLVETPYAGVIAPAQRFLKRAALAGFLLLATGLGCAWWLSGRLTRPLLELTAAADAISAGDYSMRVPVEREDEVGHLAATFNVMAERIQVSQHGLQQRFQALVDGVVDYAVFMLDPEGTVVT